MFARVGPNPQLASRFSGDYHWFDGSGHVHAVRVKGGGSQISYCNRWVVTSRLLQEAAAGVPLFTNFGDYRGWLAALHLLVGGARRLLRVKDSSDGDGTANTALVFHARKLLALHEGDLPYVLRVACDGIVETVGRLRDFSSPKKDKADSKKDEKTMKNPFTAHPKIDPATGELFGIGYNVEKKPYLQYFGLDSEGALRFNVPIDTPQPTMQHDMAITKQHAIFLDPPLIFKPEVMLGSKDKMPFVFDRTRKARFGVIDREATKERSSSASSSSSAPSDSTRWFELDACMFFHVANAWEEGNDKIKLFLCVFEDFDLDLDQVKPTVSKSKAGSGEKAAPSSSPNDVAFSGYARLNEVTLDLRTGLASRRVVDENLYGDFPRINERLTGVKSRYTYVATMDPLSPVPLFDGVAKVDLLAKDPAKAVVASFKYGKGRHGGEATFVTDPHRRNGGAEDAGFLVTYVFDEATNKSELLVLDAQDLSNANAGFRVPLPVRVPYGFHVAHVAEEELKRQAGGLAAGSGAAREE